MTTVTALQSQSINPSDNPLAQIDANITAAFPSGSRITLAIASGKSEWTSTSQLTVHFPDGKENHFFLKLATGPNSEDLAKGEFAIMSEIHKWMPDSVPRSHSWGKYADTSSIHFFLSEYIHMKQGMPNPDDLGRKLASLHRTSQSPTGKFGFHTTTCQGRIPQHVDWESNWTVFFTKLLEHVIELDFQYNGNWEALDSLSKRLVSQVLPRLLDVLVQHGRRIIPCLIHGDLWEGNTGSCKGKLYVFHAAGYYAHNEMEVANWRCYYNNISDRAYAEAYMRYFPPSEPVDEWEDRNRLYSIYYNVIYSVNHGESGKAVRQLAFSDMYFLVDKYTPFSEGEAPARLGDCDRVTLSSERDHTLVCVP